MFSRPLLRTLALAVASLATAQAATAITTTSLNLHRQPALSGPVIQVIPAQTLLTVACSGNWCRTSYRGHGGYVARSLMRPLTRSAPLSGRGVVYFRSCTAARAAGAAPLRLAHPGYRTGLDRNHNGVACEQGE
ncbi:excalibur calcium-binding domain-containing protein [Deinococcus sonorensis]|uniref:Excalibur calcium-binding domain-containing protein n=2 Tax=Deinococcus sonorensis TaxID=309891 RepID=A0AAU7U9W8_9DEIO